MTTEDRLNAIKARLGSIGPTKQTQLYGVVKRLIDEDIPWLLDQLAEDQPEIMPVLPDTPNGAKGGCTAAGLLDP